jgi:hypothetical protein
MILVSKGLFSLLGQRAMAEEKLHASYYRQVDEQTAYQNIENE